MLYIYIHIYTFIIQKYTDKIHSKQLFPSVLCYCWLGDRKGMQPVKNGFYFVGGDNLTRALHVL